MEWYTAGHVLPDEIGEASLNPSMAHLKNPHKSRVGLIRLYYATGYSVAGLKAAYKNEQAFRLETWLAAMFLPLAFWLGKNWVEMALLAGSVIAVLAAELANSAIEAVVDRISTDPHELSGRAKDLGSACVLMTLILAAGIWISAIWGLLPW